VDRVSLPGVNGVSVGAARPPRCPRHSADRETDGRKPRRWIRLDALWTEPFRLFFPVALIAGLLGVLVWPLVFWGWMERSPIQVHTRLMSLGFFGGFVFGFLGTSVPRLLKAPPFRALESIPLLGFHLLASGFYFLGEIPLGDGIMTLNACLLVALLLRRVALRREAPAPGFLMVIPGFISVLVGLGLASLNRRYQWGYEADLLIRLLMYHGFVLLCLLGAGGFLLPRFLRLGLRRMYGAEKEGNPIWRRSALITLLVGFSIMASYILDMMGHSQVGVSLRSALVVAYLFWEMPLERLRFSILGVDWILAFGLLCLPVGILVAGWFPSFRVGLSHLELAGGVGLVTLGIATRVVFGHTGNRQKLERFHPWLSLSAVLMILGIGVRIGGDLAPELSIKLYTYGALFWLLGGLLWGACVVTKVLSPDPDA
jgi:uncharacterized protein involved in response to NO